MIRYWLRFIWASPRTAWLCLTELVRPLPYEPRHVDPWAEQHERISDTLDRIELHHQPGYELGAMRVYQAPAVAADPRAAAAAGHQADPEDAPYDERLSWAAAWRFHQRGDEDAVQAWLDEGWLADAYWLRRRALAVAA